ncbi:pseudouridine synthase [Alicyclobacillus sp. SP_1]|jgi:23S rRNA pseudouridine2605 synthase|uniref:pseudouridine synthase n=1 Tax=Alicyclobacillus sp. SP_1 TaxID=2942475 RepID=UPI0021585EB5|nr:pseudouridine synthase [Alicyclobacillus sp. SP_1]
MERLQKVMASAGIASRRKCEELITDGRVRVDGVVVRELGVKVDIENQVIEVDGQPIQREDKVCLILHKPTSRISSVTDPEGRKTVMDSLEGLSCRVYPVGRLDYDTSGLLLLTNDGELTNRLLHPSQHVGKLYRATVLGMVDKPILRQLSEGIDLEDGRTAPAEVSALRQHPRESVVDLRIYEGRNRQVRRMFEALDLPVKRLKRIEFGPLSLEGLAVGQWRFLSLEEWKTLYQTAKMEVPPYPSRMTVSKHSREEEIAKKNPLSDDTGTLPSNSRNLRQRTRPRSKF